MGAQTGGDPTSAALAAAVGRLGGASRPGQQHMAEAVGRSLDGGDHLLIQAGTGTGKSLGYLVPALARLAVGEVERVVVATATLALQTQLATKDIPLALDAVATVTGRRPRAALLKGRSNYACLFRVREGAPDDGQQALMSGEDLAATLTARRPVPTDDAEASPGSSSAAAASATGAEVVMLREWAESQLSKGDRGDRDDAPAHSDRAWSQVSIPVRECLGAQRCPFGQECFVETSRDVARTADLVVTNHALLAIDAMHGQTALPAHDAVIVDEAHELVSRVTGAASVELSPQILERTARRAMTWLDDDLALELLEEGDRLRIALESVEPARVTEAGSAVVIAAQAIRTTTRRVVSALGGSEDPERRQAQAAVKEIFDIVERVAALSELDVVYVNDRERFGRELRVAPLAVAGLLREAVLKDRTTVFCSATLTAGGRFTPVAGGFGLRAVDEVPADAPVPEPDDADEGADGADDEADENAPLRWRALDVGSPFDYARQGILYVGARLPPPSRDGLPKEVLAEIAELVWAAGGRTLGLFASRRNAEAAARHVRAELPKLTVLCQGDAQLPELTRRFVAEPETSLFGTLSLWQGVDVPGDTCRLVIIDKIPFPRPDDPLMTARQQAVVEAGGNGFMAVPATHAALLLAQGSGRLIRSLDDRGMVAVLDPRLETARYGSFLRAGMPGLWPTTDRETAIGALRRLAERNADVPDQASAAG